MRLLSRLLGAKALVGALFLAQSSIAVTAILEPVGGGTGSTLGVSPTGSLTFTPAQTVNPIDPQWAGGADPTGVNDSAPALSAALSVPAISAVIPPGQGGTNYTIGNLLTVDAGNNPGLICSTYPVFRVNTVGLNRAVSTLTTQTAGMCANTTAVPSPASSSPVPTYFSTTGGVGNGATLNITWAPRNAKVQFPCGTFLFNSSVGAIHDNTEISGGGDCTNFVLPIGITPNLNWKGNFGSHGTPVSLLTNADFANGNSNIHLHDFKINSTAVLGKTSEGAVFVFTKNVKVDHVHFVGPTTSLRADDSGALKFLRSDQFWVDQNIIEGFLTPFGLWQGSTNWWITNNLFDGKGAAWDAMANNGLGSAQDYPPISNTSAFGFISKNIIRNYRSSGLNLTGLCSDATKTCGVMNDITVSENRIENVDVYHGIYIGGGSRYKILNNVISNVGSSCIYEAGGWPGQVTSDSEITGNTCYAANKNQSMQSAVVEYGGSGYGTSGTLTVLGGNCFIPPTVTYTGVSGAVTNPVVLNDGKCLTPPVNPVSVSGGSGTGATLNLVFAADTTASAILVSGTNGIIKNATITDNNVTGGGYQYAVRVADSNFQAMLSAAPAASSGGNLVGDVLTAVGGELASGSAASTFVVSSVNAGVITGVTRQYPGSYNTIPSNLVSFTSSGAGTGITMTVAWQAEGAFNTIFRPGIEDAGTEGTDSVGGTISPLTSYDQHTFTAQATFSARSISLVIANPLTTSYSQMGYVSAGSARKYQTGVGGVDETTYGVSQCYFLFDQLGALMRMRVCPDGNFNINPIVGVPAVQPLDVNGPMRIAPKTLALAGACGATTEGSLARISDSTTSTVGATVVGGGSLHVFAGCDGTNWTVIR